MSTVPTPISNTRKWTGRVLSILPSAMLLFAASSMLMLDESTLKGLAEAGYPNDPPRGTNGTYQCLGLAVVVSVLLYLIPHTAVVGAALLTGYLGGAVATHVRHEDSLGMILAPVIFAVVVWAGLVLRDPRLDAVLPWKR